MIWNVPIELAVGWPAIFIILFYQNMIADSGYLTTRGSLIYNISTALGMIVLLVLLIWSAFTFGISAPVKMILFIFPGLFAGAIIEKIIGRVAIAVMGLIVWPILAILVVDALIYFG